MTSLRSALAWRGCIRYGHATLYGDAVLLACADDVDRYPLSAMHPSLLTEDAVLPSVELCLVQASLIDVCLTLLHGLFVGLVCRQHPDTREDEDVEFRESLFSTDTLTYKVRYTGRVVILSPDCWHLICRHTVPSQTGS